jgi:hypothetical protein
MFRIDVDVAGNLDKTLEILGATEVQVRTAAMRAINKTALWVRAQSARKIGKQRQIQLKLIRQKLRIIRANRTALKAFVVANLWGIKASKLGVPKQNATGASVGKHQFPGAFVAKMSRTGHVGIFKRKTSKRLPIREQYVQLEPEASQIIRETVENEASAVFSHHFEHELNYAANIAQ